MFQIITLSVLLFSSQSFAVPQIPEASGATRVGKQIVISGDEEPSALWLTRAGTLTTDKIAVAHKWDDLESLATISETKFLAMTSQSLKRTGKRKAEREQLMVFEKNENRISLIKSFQMRDQIIAFLEKNFANDLDLNQVRGNGPSDGGLNVEGLAYISGKIYFGMRSPLTKKGEAIILVIPDVESNATIKSAITINLGGLGIRGLETDGEKLLILAGSNNDTAEVFKLLGFDPSSGKVTDPGYRAFSTLVRPEALVLNEDGSLVFAQDFETEETQEVLVRVER